MPPEIFSWNKIASEAGDCNRTAPKAREKRLRNWTAAAPRDILSGAGRSIRRKANTIMMKNMLTGKIHTARLTGCDLHYEGSMEIDPVYLKEANILPYEKILVVNRTNGERLETYAIPGEPGKGAFCLNGPAALKGKRGDVVTIMAFSLCTEEEARRIQPVIIVLDENNRIVQRKGRTANADFV